METRTRQNLENLLSGHPFRYVTSAPMIQYLYSFNSMTTAFDTVWPSDSVEFCPENPQNIFVCGTYKLDQASEAADSESSNALASVAIGPKKQRRQGKCQVFEVISGIRREL
jgi:hypothetical protein